jgi:hypothetical protein
MESDRQSPQASPEAVQSVERLYNAIQTQFPEAVAVFVNKWTPWHDLCIKHMSSPSYNYLATSLYPDAHANLFFSPSAIGGLEALTKADEYEKLKNLGPKIIPFIVFKLAQNPENNSHAVFLCKCCLLGLVPQVATL